VTAETHANTGDIDWAAARTRLARAAAMLGESARPSEDRSAEILAERARKLAQPLAMARDENKELEVLIFVLGTERVALETKYVRAASPLADVTLIPGTAAFVSGVTNFRGEILPVFDIRELFNGASRTHDESSRIVFLGREGTEFGIVADEILETTRVPIDGLCPRPWRRDDTAAKGADGITGDALNVLDGQALLDDDRFLVDQSRKSTRQ